MTLLFLAGTALCAFLAIREKRLLQAALWLAGASAITSLLLYSLGAPQAAVIELSVGAGLVFILFVFAINLAPGEAPRDPALVPEPLAWTLVGLVALLVGELAWPYLAAQATTASTALGTVLWQDRQLDALVQIVIIFAGALTVAGLLAPERQSKEAPAGAVQAAAERQAPTRPSPPKPLPELQPALPKARVAPQKEKVA